MNRIAVTIRNGNNVYVPVPDVLTWQPESGGPRLLLYDYEAGDDTQSLIRISYTGNCHSQCI